MDGGGSIAVGGDGTSYEVQMFTADLNGDDKLDLIILQPAASGGTGTMTVLLGNGDGTFGTPTNYPVSAYPSGGALADLNADGKLDVALDTGNYSAGEHHHHAGKRRWHIPKPGSNSIFCQS